MGEKLVAEVLADCVAFNSGPQVHIVGHGVDLLMEHNNSCPSEESLLNIHFIHLN